ncbi:MAG TPA: hypothetical protein VGI39_34860 [Polyangiaceae bacterium]
MFASGPDRGPPVALRGWLSDVYFPALLDKESPSQALEALAGRLGAKATVDDPLQGRAAGIPAIPDLLGKTAAWLRSHAAAYERVAFTTGIDRDVTEGTLALTFENKTLDLPVAVVAERRRSREVELRIYYATQSIPDAEGGKRPRAPLVQPSVDPAPPAPVDGLLTALAQGDAKGATATFETDGGVRDARGMQHAKNGGALQSLLEGWLAGNAGLELRVGGAADDGRTCALEYNLVRIRGREVPARAGLMILERGDSALLRAVRLYSEFE